MTDQTTSQDYITKLEKNINDLIQVLVDPNLWSFLTDKERERVSIVLQNCHKQA